jgi:hypothetical protein
VYKKLPHTGHNTSAPNDTACGPYQQELFRGWRYPGSGMTTGYRLSAIGYRLSARPYLSSGSSFQSFSRFLMGSGQAGKPSLGHLPRVMHGITCRAIAGE